MNKKLDEDIWYIRPRLFPMILIGEVGYGGDEDGPSYYRDYTNLDLEAEVNTVKKYIENQFYSKEEFQYVLEGLKKRAKTYFETDFSKHISVNAKHDGKYYTGMNTGGDFIINEKLSKEYKAIIVLKKEKLNLLYEKLIQEILEKYNTAIPMSKQQYSKFDFTKQKLESQLLEIAKSNGHTNMMPYLKELLEKIKTFNDFDFECDFFLNLHYICEEHAKEFWSKGHREEITKFFGNARIVTDVFENTWDYYNKPNGKSVENKSQSQKYNLGDYALMQVYLSLSNEGEAVTNANKNEIAGKYKIHGKRFYEAYNRFSNNIARTETISKRSDKEKNIRFENVIKLLSPFPKALKRAIDEQKAFIAASQKQYE